ncbi:MAG: AI-2E family transporter [Spirochaetia bacterium]|jgi:predicted PurR-regulated permease PerM|nr:AI-2E family transporter [Spirochaetia bacterium]
MYQGITKKYIFLIFFIALFILVARLFYPFMTVILWSGLLYAFINPLYERCTRVLQHGKAAKSKRPFSEKILAGVFSVLGVLIIIVPLSFLALELVKQMVDLSGDFLNFIDQNRDIFSLSPNSPVGGLIYRMSDGAIDLSHINVVHELKSALLSSSNKLIGLSGTLIKNVASLVMTLAFMVFTLYFLLVDGKHLAGLVVSAIPIERTYTTMFMEKFSESGRQLTLGYFLVSLYQAVVMFILCLVFKLEGALVLAVLTAIASFIPMVGTSLVWVPTSLILGFTGEAGRAVAFFILAAFFVAFSDNFIRPMVLGEKLKIHPLLIFFAIVGGLQIFGINGLLLGPLVVVIFFAAAGLYEQIDDIQSAAPDKKETSSSK